MEKKDYLSLQSKYSHLADYQERYHKELLEFINDAFEKHGNEFMLKPEGYDAWEERRKEEDFYAMDELPYYLDIGVNDDNAHETHISHIRQIERANYKAIEIDGWDWYINEWVEGCEIFYNIDSLKSVADFINAVLEQEQEGTLVADNSIENFKPVNNDLLHETIADIAFNMGWEHFDDIDSREMARCIIQWAKEFEKTHEKTDWASEADYLAEIDEYSSTKIAEYLLGKK